MKTIIQYVFLVGILFFVASCSSTRNPQSKADKYAWIDQQINSGKFKIEVDQAHPLSGSVINLTSIYTLEVRNDSVLSWLPYFGRAYVAPMDPTKSALQFSILYTNYKKVYSLKRGYTITFNARTSEDNFRFLVEIGSEGYSSIGVTSDKKSYIRFTGQMVK